MAIKSKAKPEAIARPAAACPARWPAIVLLIALALGGTLRLWGLGHQPPGCNQDEAAHAWNAWCLLKTGMDQAGVHWPLFYSRTIGSNDSTLYIYLLIPFQAIGGFNVVTMRLPSVLAGMACIALVYWVASKLFGRPAGAVAAVLTALNPWQLHLSRWGHAANIGAFLGLCALALMLLAGFWRPDDQQPRGRIYRLARLLSPG